MDSWPRLPVFGRWLALVGLLLVVVSQSGCLMRSILYFARQPTVPMAGWEVRMDPARRRECLVVFLPGLFDIPDELFDGGVVDEAVRASTRCDLAVMDSNIGYYTNAVITERLRADVLRTAEARGYTELWVVGISMGGLGGILLAASEPERIRGLVLIAPWLGHEDVVRTVIDAGGLASWTPPEIDLVSPDLTDATAAALLWLRERPERARPELYLAYGESDGWGHHAGLATEVVPADHIVTREGAHDWTTWAALFRDLMRRPPWDPASTTRDPDRRAPTLIR